MKRSIRALALSLVAFCGPTGLASAQADSASALERAAQAAAAGRYVDALAAQADAIVAALADPAPHIARARLLALLGHSDLAIADLRLATVLTPDDAGLQNELCNALARANHDLDGALAACNAAVRIEPDNHAMLSTRGYLHLRRGEFAKAEKDYADALTLYPASANEMFGFGIAIIHVGREIEGRGEIASATLDSAGLVSEWEARGFGIRGEAKPGKPVTTAAQPVITAHDPKIILDRDETYVPLNGGCGRVAPADKRASMNPNDTWIGACRFGLIHGEGRLGAAAPVSRHAYGREITPDAAGDATAAKLALAYAPAEAASGN
jgi:Flp pilus assembly protein TadD